jgi:aerobic carbon-monoxide dehydrogenase small subunit
VNASGTMTLTLTLNGESHTAEVHPMARLLDVIREGFGLTGTKEGCGEGECGACSVILNGALVNACLIPAVQAQGCDLRTVEGLAPKDGLGPLQEAFLRHGGAQCGICTPGMLVAGTYLLEQGLVHDEASAREGLAGNLCRCTGYVKIIDSLLAGEEAGR